MHEKIVGIVICVTIILASIGIILYGMEYVGNNNPDAVMEEIQK